jgi:polycystin 1L2
LKKQYFYRSLGELSYLRVWHDNSGLGSDASWFLKYILVRDLQTMETSYFICEKWLAVEKDSGEVGNRNMVFF